MKNKELFDKTVGILVRAYQEGTLQHVNCHACAVGNIVAGNLEYSYKQNPCEIEKEHFSLIWSHLDNYEVDNGWFRPVAFGRYATGNQITEIESTGYNIEQLRVIEDAFEGVIGNDTDGYNGLMSVVDALMIIHEANIEETQQAKELFVLNK